MPLERAAAGPGQDFLSEEGSVSQIVEKRFHYTEVGVCVGVGKAIMKVSG